MGKSDLVQKVGGPIHCWSRGPRSWGTGPHGGCAYGRDDDFWCRSISFNTISISVIK
jgi:hypothetical protein